MQLFFAFWFVCKYIFMIFISRNIRDNILVIQEILFSHMRTFLRKLTIILYSETWNGKGYTYTMRSRRSIFLPTQLEVRD